MKKITVYVAFVLLVLGVNVFLGAKVAESKTAKPWSCGSTIAYGEVTYNTVIVGTQCWFKENLNVGTVIGNLEIPDNTAPILNNPNTVSKWCYNDTQTYCASEGGLYTWAETNGLPDSCNNASCSVPTLNQGICPAGWHIPTDAQFYTLENYLTTPGQTCDAARLDWGCSGAGTALRLGGSSGFDALSAGHHETAGENSFFDKRESSIAFISSSEYLPYLSYAYLRGLNGVIGGGSDDLVGRSAYLKNFGWSVRCLSDIAIVGPPTNASQCMNKGWKTFNNPTFKSQGECLSYF